MTPRELEEYRALRDTIRERGTARIWVFLAGFVGWGALTIATGALATLPVATCLPLLILAVAFEAVFSLHVAVERIGRYVQVFLEDRGDPGDSIGWEHVAMAFGPPLKGTSVDPLFTVHFIVAVVLNTVPALLFQPVSPVPGEVAVVLGAHLLVVARILLARRTTGQQRTADLRRFRELMEESGKFKGQSSK
jgi:hypothetical protein